MSNPEGMIPLNHLPGDSQDIGLKNGNTVVMMGVEDMRLTLRRDFEHAWNLNDFAHREEHFREVEGTGLEICRRLNMQVDPRLMMLAAYFHDMFAWSRFNHHHLSATWVRTTDYPLIDHLDHASRELVAQGCEFHRASGVGEFPSSFAELVCSADRGTAGDIKGHLTRAVRTRFFKEPYASTWDVFSGALSHIKQKYGSGGYARYPNMYRMAFEDELTAQQKAFDTATVSKDPESLEVVFIVNNQVVKLDL